MVTHNIPHKIWAFLIMLGFLSRVHAASSIVQAASTTSTSPNVTNTLHAGPPMITMSLVSAEYLDYNVVLKDNFDQVVTAALDFAQPNLWLMNPDYIVGCLVVASMLSDGIHTSYPDILTYSGRVYDPGSCYFEGQYTPMTTTVVTNGTHVSTATTTVNVLPTSGSFNVTYPYDGYAEGQSMNANFSLGLVGESSELSLGSVLYILVSETSQSSGSFGLGGPSRSGGVFDTLKSRGLTYGNGYSLYLLDEPTSENLSGYLLLGSVDKNLYSGDLYVFPQIPHVGWSDPSVILPILQMDSVSLVNLETSQLAPLYNLGSMPVSLDVTQVDSYLPRPLLINLALQLNAFYLQLVDEWVLNCTSVSNINASILFAFGPLSVNVPLSTVIQSSRSNLTFSDGLPACFLDLYASDGIGYAIIGTNLLLSFYMAVDNEGGSIAVANANTNLNPSLLLTASQNMSTVGYIRSGYIPFATKALVSSGITFTYGLVNPSTLSTNPTLLPNALISSGHVYISLKKVSSASRASGSASAASAKSTSGGAGSFNNSLRESNHAVIYTIMLLGGIMGLLIV